MREVREQLAGSPDARIDRPHPEALLRALLAAFPDRVARRRDSSTGKGVMVGGRGVRMAPQSAVTDAELFVCVDVDAGQSEAIVRQASAIERGVAAGATVADGGRSFSFIRLKRASSAAAARIGTIWCSTR